MNVWLEKIYNLLMLIFQKVSDKVVVEPDRPNAKYPRPDFVEVPGVKISTHGNYRTKTGKAEGLIVHYTVSGREASSAKSVLSYLARKGLGCMVMDAYGTIYVGDGFDFEKDVAWHAGSSAFGSKKGMSRYCMGMEICGWGRLTPESRKRAKTMRKSDGHHNIHKGDYEPYTKEQEEALVNFILWYKQINPDFNIDMVLGHDEVCVPNGRKTDPGASLSKSMPDFRAYLKNRLREV